jgi:hypothetical protein
MPGWSTHAGPMEHQEQTRDGPGEVTPGILMTGMSGNRPGNELRPPCEARNPKTSEALQIPSFDGSAGRSRACGRPSAGPARDSGAVFQGLCKTLGACRARATIVVGIAPRPPRTMITHTHWSRHRTLCCGVYYVAPDLSPASHTSSINLERHITWGDPLEGRPSNPSSASHEPPSGDRQPPPRQDVARSLQ